MAHRTKEQRLTAAIKIFKDKHGTMNQKMAFLTSKGMPSEEITEALNQASGGELLRAAGVD